MSPEVLDRVMAVVSGELILLSDVNAARELGLVHVPERGGNPRPVIEERGGNPRPLMEAPGDAEVAALSALIDRALILAEVDRYAPPEPPVASIDQGLQAVLARFPSRQAFDAALARAGWDETRLWQMIRDNLRIRDYEERRFAIPPPGEDDIERYYRAHVEAFTHDGRVTPLVEAHSQIEKALVDERRAALVAEWVESLRSRASITSLYFPGR